MTGNGTMIETEMVKKKGIAGHLLLAEDMVQEAGGVDEDPHLVMDTMVDLVGILTQGQTVLTVMKTCIWECWIP